MGNAVTEVRIEALPGRIDEVARAVDVLLTAPESPALPLRLQGMGARSLAVVMVFQAYMRLRLGSGFDALPHSISAFEEPEAHLHPHPQRTTFDIIAELPGQKIVSTHSPFVAQVADLFDIRVITRANGQIACRSVPRSGPDGSDTFEPDDLAKLQRFIQRHNGEVLFARCVVLHEGETELGALPAFAAHLWGTEPTGLGITFVSVDGAGSFKHYVRVLDYLGIPFVMLVDGDTEGDKGIKSAEGSLGRRMSVGDEVFQLPSGTDFETHLIEAGYCDQLLSAAVALHGQEVLDQYVSRNHGQKLKGGKLRDYKGDGWEKRLALDFCRSHMKSVSGGRLIAEMILSNPDPDVVSMVPPQIGLLLGRVSAILEGAP